jgi:diacylglycerol kinase (ATP)
MSLSPLPSPPPSDPSAQPPAPPPALAEARPSVLRAFLLSFLYAWRGLLNTVLLQRNMRLHVVSGVLVGLVGSGIYLGLAEKVTLIFCVLLIFFAEILNSALEHLVDLATRHFDEKARLTKDAAAGGVLVLAIGTVVIFAAILVHNWGTVSASGEQILRQVLLGLPLAGCVALLVSPVPQRRAWVEVLVFAVGCVLLGALALRTASSVFTALTAGLHVLAGAVARERRRLGSR